MSCHYAVRFAPDSLRDFHDEIKIQTQSTMPITVPLLGRRPPPKLTCKKMYNQLVDGWLRMGLLPPPLGNFADYLVEN